MQRSILRCIHPPLLRLRARYPLLSLAKRVFHQRLPPTQPYRHKKDKKEVGEREGRRREERREREIFSNSTNTLQIAAVTARRPAAPAPWRAKVRTGMCGSRYLRSSWVPGVVIFCEVSRLVSPLSLLVGSAVGDQRKGVVITHISSVHHILPLAYAVEVLIERSACERSDGLCAGRSYVDVLSAADLRGGRSSGSHTHPLLSRDDCVDCGRSSGSSSQRWK